MEYQRTEKNHSRTCRIKFDGADIVRIVVIGVSYIYYSLQCILNGLFFCTYLKVEVSPPYDAGQITAIAAADLVYEVLSLMVRFPVLLEEVV